MVTKLSRTSEANGETNAQACEGDLTALLFFTLGWGGVRRLLRVSGLVAK